jgi:predicted PurR-regulated permease PerM
MSSTPISHRVFIERLVIAVLVIGIALVLWALRGLFLLAFGAVLVAVILGLIATPLRTRARLPASLALLCAVLIVAGLLATSVGMFGAEVFRQAEGLRQLIPAAWAAFEHWLDGVGLGEPVRQWTMALGQGSGVVGQFGRIAMSVGNGIADALLVIVGGIYLAAQPDLYRTGLLKLVPKRGRPLAADALDASSRALHLWLLGRLVSMVAVGTLTWIGLTLIGVPAALTLALLAALLEFVPFIGPIVAAVPAILLGFAAGPDKAIWVALLFLVIQQIEGYVLEPLVQQRAVNIPPALLLFAVVAGGLIFGLVGVFFAAPLTVVLYVLTKRLYVQEALHTETPLPGEDQD